jgi:hypothetical protein
VATQITATTPRTGPAPRLGVPGLAILAVIAVAVIGVGFWSRADSTSEATADAHVYGVGYPLHGGLAGPSRVDDVSTVDVAGHYGPGYPLSGGLAGPSRPEPTIDVAGHYGPGYPLSGGLAGPSRLDIRD